MPDSAGYGSMLGAQRDFKISYFTAFLSVQSLIYAGMLLHALKKETEREVEEKVLDVREGGR